MHMYIYIPIYIYIYIYNCICTKSFAASPPIAGPCLLAAGCWLADLRSLTGCFIGLVFTFDDFDLHFGGPARSTALGLNFTDLGPVPWVLPLNWVAFGMPECAKGHSQCSVSVILLEAMLPE